MSQFANYSNTVQSLRAGVNQLNPTSTQITDDKANFEQQFLIGAALAAKMKATDKLVGLFKKSKTLKSLKGKTEDQLRSIVRSGQDRANGLANDLRSKITGTQSTPAPPTQTPTVEPDNLDQLKDLVDKANGKVKDTTKALEDAENKIVDSRDAVRESIATRDSAEAIVKSDAQRAVTQAGGRIRAGQQIADAENRKALNTARNDVDKKQALSEQAEQDRNDLSEQLQQHQADAQQAQKDLDNAKPGESPSAPSTAVEEEQEASNVASDAERAIKVERDVGDVEKVAAESSEADPIGLLVAGIAAIGTQIIGRRLKAHETIMSGSKPPPTTYSSTLGATV